MNGMIVVTITSLYIVNSETMKFAIVILIVVHDIFIHLSKMQLKKYSWNFRYLRNFKRVNPCEIQRNMFITSWPAAGADFSVHYRGILGAEPLRSFWRFHPNTPPLFFRIFLRTGGVFQVLSPDVRKKSNYTQKILIFSFDINFHNVEIKQLF